MKAIITERFESLTRFVEVIKKREPNKIYQNRSLSSESGSRDFTLTDSYDESISILMNGYKDGLKNLTASAGSKISHTSKIQKSLPSTGVVGYVPHIPNAITGVPLSMIASTPVEQKAKVITIYYSIEAAGGVAAERFIEAGRNLLEVIMTLELNGYRVGLGAIMSFNTETQKAFCIVKIKDHRQPSNPLKIAYPILHPSFMRRQGFRWLETQPDVADRDFTNGYGKILRVFIDGYSNYDDCRKYLRKHGILEDGYFYTEVNEAASNTPERLVEVMGIRKRAKLENK